MLEIEEIKKMMETRNLMSVAEKLDYPYWRLRHALISKDPKYWPIKILSDFLEGDKECKE